MVIFKRTFSCNLQKYEVFNNIFYGVDLAYVRIYISLTGAKLEGSSAVTQCRVDLAYKLNPNLSARPELIAVCDYELIN